MPRPRSDDDRPLRLLYVVSEDWYFLSHRLPMARAARDAGFEVHVATRVTRGGSAIEAERFILHPIPFSRGWISPFAMLRTMIAVRRIHREVRPQVAHHVSLQPSIIGSLAAIGLPVARINALTGLGFTFTSQSAVAIHLKFAIGFLIRLIFNNPHSIALIQNPDDRSALLHLGIREDRIVMIQGSGVDTERLKELAVPDGPVTIGFVGRLLADKGVGVLVEAHRILRQRGSRHELLIAGSPDIANPASITAREAQAWSLEPGIKMLGYVDDITQVWTRAHIAALPSRREGLPMSLLEAAACGRPMVATDVPGCREIAIAGETALLVPPDDAPSLADALWRLIQSPQLRETYGAAARRLVTERFSDAIIGRKVVELYKAVSRANHCNPIQPACK